MDFLFLIKISPQLRISLDSYQEKYIQGEQKNLKIKEMRKRIFNRDEFSIVFFKKRGESLISFGVKGDEKLTEKLLSCFAPEEQKIKEEDIPFVYKKCFYLLEKNICQWSDDVPEQELEKICMEKFEKKYSVQMNPKAQGLEFAIILPDERVFRGSGSNTNLAIRRAAIFALKEISPP